MFLAAGTARAKVQSQSKLSVFQQGGKRKQELWEGKRKRHKKRVYGEVNCANHREAVSSSEQKQRIKGGSAWEGGRHSSLQKGGAQVWGTETKA